MTTSTTTEDGTPVLDDDPFSLEILADPGAFHERLREAGPVVRLSRYDIWAAGRYDEVFAALNDWETFISGAGAGLADFRKEKPWRPPSLLLEADPPEHTPRRKVLTRILSQRALRALRETFEREADTLVEDLVAGGSFDAVRDLAEVYPLKVFPDAVGLAQEGRENLLPYGNLAFNAFGPRNELLAKAMAEAEPVQEWIMAQTRREVLRPGGFGAQIWAAADAGEIPHAEAPLLVRSLLTAGVDTTVNGISSAVYCAASFPDQWRLVRDNPASVRLAFEEAVRFESPVQTFFRTTSRDTELGGVSIPEGNKVLLFLGAANHDPRRFPDPDRYDFQRKVSGHVGFGMGVHQCVGQHVARLEGEIVLAALARKVDSIEITGEPRRRLNNTLRAWDSLPVTVQAATG